MAERKRYDKNKYPPYPTIPLPTLIAVETHIQSGTTSKFEKTGPCPKIQITEGSFLYPKEICYGILCKNCKKRIGTFDYTHISVPARLGLTTQEVADQALFLDENKGVRKVTEVAGFSNGKVSDYQVTTEQFEEDRGKGIEKGNWRIAVEANLKVMGIPVYSKNP